MTMIDVLLRLREAGVDMWLDDGRLTLSVPREDLDASLVAQISAHEAELVEFVRKSRATPDADRPVARPNRHGALPLSFAQQSMWLVLELGNEGFAHNVLPALRIRGALHRDALRRALEEIVRRHEVLRTTFGVENGHPVQRVHEADTVEVGFVEEDLSDLTDTERAVSERLDTELATPFDVEVELPFRFKLLRVADEHHVLCATFVHLVFDGASFGVLFHELEELYRASVAGGSPALAELPFQYADYALWQRRSRTDHDRHLEYWRAQLEGITSLDLPTDRPRPQTSTFAGCRHSFSLSAEIRDRLGALGRRESCTRFMTLLSVFLVQLVRWTEQEDIAVGAPSTNRHTPESERLIGLFLNTLVLRTDLSGNPTFREVMGRVRASVLGAFDHADLPIEQLVTALRPARDPGRNPLFQVMFNLVDEADLPRLPGLDVEPIIAEYGNSIFDLSLVMGERGGVFEYGPDLFDGETIARLGRQFVRLVEIVTRDPDARIWDLVLLSSEEHDRLVCQLNDTARPYPNGQCIHTMFSAVAGRVPDAIAVESTNDSRTFSAVESRANRIANYLIARGAGPSRAVAVCVHRSVEIVEILLGILKTGAAYLPLDPSYPRERLAYMLEDAAPALLVTEPAAAGRLPQALPTVVDLRRDREAIGAREDDPPRSIAEGADAAYVLYTSGSTGRPKGVVGRHRSVINRCCWMWKELPFQRGEVCCHKTSLSWVDSTWEIFAPLLAGLPIVVIEEDVVRDAHMLLETLATNRVSRLVLVPSLLRAMLDSSDSLGDELPDLRYWLCGGEEMSVELATRLARAVPHGILLNMYGFSESSADVAVYDVRDGIPEHGAVPIGRPIWNTRVYLLGAHGELVPQGAVGEICVGGDGLAQGYLARPDLTAEKFVPDPFSEVPDRLYRTGDLGRWRSDGNLEYLGREDRQAKVRGHRIELAEIDHALAQHDAVAASAVVAQRDGSGESRLAGFAVLHPGAAATVTELRGFLRQRLPEHMVPQMLHVHPDLPLLPNGKVDYRALSELVAAQRRGVDPTYEPPRSGTERMLAAIFQDVLELDRVGRTDAFSELGGHSLLGVRVIGRIEHALGVRLRLGDLFAQDLGQVAAMCDARRARGRTRRAVPRGRPAG